MKQVAPGLWRWVVTHPEWEPPKQEDSPTDWPAEVGCVAYETPNTLVLIDPLVADGDHAELDERAARKERVAILITVKWHERSRAELIGRYGASTALPEGVGNAEVACRSRKTARRTGRRRSVASPTRLRRRSF